jgi:hypothetical protein
MATDVPQAPQSTGATAQKLPRSSVNASASGPTIDLVSTPNATIDTLSKSDQDRLAIALGHGPLSNDDAEREGEVGLLRVQLARFVDESERVFDPSTPPASE